MRLIEREEEIVFILRRENFHVIRSRIDQCEKLQQYEKFYNRIWRLISQ